MSISYTVSALQWIDDAAPTEPMPGFPPNLARVLPQVSGPATDPDRQNRIARILGWRVQLAEKYRSQLDEDLVWDENSELYTSEQQSPDALLMLTYVAAMLAQNGPGVARTLRGLASPPIQETIPILLEAKRRGFAGSFPQLLLNAHYWLPFHRDMIIEEQNWRGTIERYGSVVHLNDEITRLRSFIASADPSAPAWPSNQNPADANVLVAAWQASASILRLSAAAIAYHLPLWTSE